MGVDCRIHLRQDCRVDDVAKVIGILAGLKPEKVMFDGRSGGYYCQVPGVEVKSSGAVVEMAVIVLSGNLVDGRAGHSCYYHFEGEPSGRLVSMASTPFWCAVAKGVVDFFGGRVDFNDCDSVQTDYAAKPKGRNNPTDGEAWGKFQDRMLKLKPLTRADLAKMAKYDR